MEVVVAYDVSTESAAGRRRLRKVAKVCEGAGQRVQGSVFECILTEGEHQLMVARLCRIIDPSEDSLRIYRIREPHESSVEVFGRVIAFDIRDPLVL